MTDIKNDKSPLPLTDPRDAVPHAHRVVHYTTYYLRYAYRYVGKRKWFVILTMFSKTKVTASHTQCKCGYISETVPGRVVVTTDH